MIHEPAELAALTGGDDFYIIGGAEIYGAFMDHMDELFITHVIADHDGDTVFSAYEEIFPLEHVLIEHPDFVIKRHSR